MYSTMFFSSIGVISKIVTSTFSNLRLIVEMESIVLASQMVFQGVCGIG